jgi:hypothetical protein
MRPGVYITLQNLDLLAKVLLNGPVYVKCDNLKNGFTCTIVITHVNLNSETCLGVIPSNVNKVSPDEILSHLGVSCMENKKEDVMVLFKLRNNPFQFKLEFLGLVPIPVESIRNDNVFFNNVIPGMTIKLWTFQPSVSLTEGKVKEITCEGLTLLTPKEGLQEFPFGDLSYKFDLVNSH